MKTIIVTLAIVFTLPAFADTSPNDERRAEMVAKMRKSVMEIAHEYEDIPFAFIFTNDDERAAAVQRNINDLESLASLNSRIEERQRQIADLQGKVVKLESTIEDRQGEIAKQDEDIAQMSKDFRSRHQQASLMLDETNRDIQAKQGQLKFIDRQIAEGKEQINQVQSIIDEKQRELNTVVTTLNNLINEAANMSESVSMRQFTPMQSISPPVRNQSSGGSHNAPYNKMMAVDWSASQTDEVVAVEPPEQANETAYNETPAYEVDTLVDEDKERSSIQVVELN